MLLNTFLLTYSQISVSMNSTKNKRKAGRIDMKGTHVGRVLGPKSVYVRPVVLFVSSMGR